MKHLPIESDQFNYLLKGFSQWLDIFGYAEQTVQSLPTHIREFLHYVETVHYTTDIRKVKNKHIYHFVKYLEQRRSERTQMGLSASSINKEILALQIFAQYLQATGRVTLDVTVRRLENNMAERTVLTTDEIKALYESTFYHSRENPEAMGQRDRAIMAVFYGCGLRKAEATALNLKDIQLEQKVLFVSHGKGNKERFVPIARKSLEDLRIYIEEGRQWFLQDHKRSAYTKKFHKEDPLKENVCKEALFLNQTGERLTSGFYSRLKILKERSGIEKDFSLHTLRHSIATHLMQSGMPMEEIAKFLGHASLESTQKYTHISEHLNNFKQSK